MTEWQAFDLLDIPGVVGVELQEPDYNSLLITVVQEFAEVPYRTLELQKIAARMHPWTSITVTTRLCGGR